MKFTWEPQDIQPGIIVGKSERVERWMIGYDPSVRWSDDPIFSPKWALISLEDGMISHHGQQRAQLAEHLNRSGDIPAVLFPMIKYAKEDAK